MNKYLEHASNVIALTINTFFDHLYFDICGVEKFYVLKLCGNTIIHFFKNLSLENMTYIATYPLLNLKWTMFYLNSIIRLNDKKSAKENYWTFIFSQCSNIKLSLLKISSISTVKVILSSNSETYMFLPYTKRFSHWQSKGSRIII